MRRRLLPLLLVYGALGPVWAAPEPPQPAPAAAVRGPQSGLVLPPASQVTLDERRSGKEASSLLQLPPSTDPRERVSMVHVLEGRVEGIVTAAQVADLYRREGFLHPEQRPLAQPPGLPRMMGTPAPVPPVLPGGPGALRSGPRAGVSSPGRTPASPAPSIDSTAFQLANPAGLLVILAVPEPPEGPTQVRVVQLIGTLQPVRALQVANTVANGLLVFGLRGWNLGTRPPPMPPGATAATPVWHVRRQEIPNLINVVNAELPPDVGGPLVALLQQADAVSVVQYSLGYLLPDRGFVAFYQAAARANGWRPVFESQVRPQAPSVAYQLPGRDGLFYFQARPVPPQRPVGTALTVIHLQGNINVDQGRRAVPAPVAPAPVPSRIAPAQPRVLPTPRQPRPGEDPLDRPRLERLRW